MTDLEKDTISSPYDLLPPKEQRIVKRYYRVMKFLWTVGEVRPSRKQAIRAMANAALPLMEKAKKLAKNNQP